MARRRYISTNISTDPKVNILAEKYGDFAALLYTWMIPHVRRIPGVLEAVCQCTAKRGEKAVTRLSRKCRGGNHDKLRDD